MKLVELSKHATSLRVSLRKYSKLLQLKWIIVGAAILLFLGGVALLAMPINYEGTEKNVLSFSTEYKDEVGIELGIKQIAQEGRKGVRSIKYQYTQSLFDYIFLPDNATKKEIESTVVSAPINKVVLNGIRKWQYMMCSNGTYRYFSDEQFKSKNVGFTSKSPDNCAQNNQGNKLSLADSPTGNMSTVRPTYVPPKCNIVDVPYKTVYQDVNWLYIGETQQGYGMNGFKYICSDGSFNSSYPPTDKIIYRGTKERLAPPSYVTAPSVPTQDAAAKRKCDSDYSYAKTQLSINGAGNSSAMEQLQYYYAQCLRNAGY